MSPPSLPTETLREALDELIAHGGNLTQASLSLGLARNTFCHRIDVAKRKHPEWFEGLSEKLNDSGGTERARPLNAPERPLGDEVHLHRARNEAKAARTKYKDAVGRIADLQEKLEGYEALGNVSATPAEWTIHQQPVGEKSLHVPLLLTSDFQIGEVINAEETEHGYAYNTEIFKSRYRRMIETTIRLSFEHGGKNWTYPGIVYARGGDTISGGIHEELRETDDLTPIEAVEVAFEEESAGIVKLREAFGRVHIPDCGGGNHDRTTHKPRSKMAHANFDRLVNFMLRREFRLDERISFQNTKSMDVRFNLCNSRILLTHGDRIGSRGGQGFIGPAATVMRGAQKVIMEQSAMGEHVDVVMMGHFHTPMYLGWVMVNGSMPGYSEFAKMNRMRPFPPQQFLSYWHEGRGCVDIKPIILTED